MKIKTKIAIQYAIVTTVLMTVFASVIYFTSAYDRETEFYKTLHREGLSKANLFFKSKTAPEILHSIYENNVAYIDEVEVAVFDSLASTLYHDAKEIDIVTITPQLITEVFATKKDKQIKESRFQRVAFIFNYDTKDYVVTATAYDGYGYNKQDKLILNLSILTLIAIVISFLLGYFLAGRALKPVAKISEEMKNITASNLHLRLSGYNEKDEFGELAVSFNKVLDIIETSFNSQKMFVSNVSHELRTPLAILVGEIDLALLKDRSITEYKETLTNSKLDAEHLIKLVNGLLDLAKAGYDENSITMTQVRIDEVLLDARDLVLKNNPGYKVDLQFNFNLEEDISPTTYGNEYLLKTTFINLMENSCKFSLNKTATVQISSVNNNIEIRFSDTGIGIPQEDLQNIFTPFYRGTNKSFTSGSGIGLALVNKVIGLHKAKIDIESKVGEGTVIRVCL